MTGPGDWCGDKTPLKTKDELQDELNVMRKHYCCISWDRLAKRVAKASDAITYL